MIFHSKKIMLMIFLTNFFSSFCCAASVDSRAAFFALYRNFSCVKKFIILETHVSQTNVVFRDDRDFENVEKKSYVENWYNPADAKIYVLYVAGEQDLELLRASYGPISFDTLYVLSRGKIEQTFNKEHTENILRNYSLKNGDKQNKE